MKLLKSVKFLMVIAPVAFLVGCGDASIGKSVQVKLDPDSQSASIELEMTSGMEVSLAGKFPLPKDLGELYFTQSTRESNAKIGLKVSVAKLIEDKINVISTLPSGAPFPAAILPPLFKVPVMKNDQYDLNAVFSLTPELQMGALIGMKVLSTNYIVSGIAVCQNFRNAESKAFAAVCLYGPNTANNTYGGLFLGGTFGEVIKSQLVAKSESAVAKSGRILSLTSASEVFEAPASLDLPVVDQSSEVSEYQIHDPAKQLDGRNGLKTMRNVQKIFKVRR